MQEKVSTETPELFDASTLEARARFTRFGGTVRDKSRGSVVGLHVEFPSGWTVSVIWGAGTYSDNYDASFDEAPAPSTTAEVACWRGNGDMCKWADGDNVQGWQSWEQVQTLLKAAAEGALTEPVTLDGAQHEPTGA